MLSLSQRITFLLLWLTIFTTPWQKGIIIPGIGSVNKLLGILLVGAAIFTVIIQKKIRKTPLFFYLLYVFVFLNIFSYFWSENPSETIEKSFLFLQVSFLAWTIYEFANSEQRVNSLFQAYVLGCSIIAIQSIQLFLNGSFIVSDTRFFIEGYNPNQLGIFWALSLPVSVYLIINGISKYIFYVPLAVFCILLTGSRAASLLLIFLSICILWVLFKYKVRFRKLITACLMIVGYIVVTKIPTGQLERLLTIKSEFSSGTFNGRTLIWQAGLTTFSESPILGVGSGGFAEAAVEYSSFGEAYNAHNAYLSILVENGLIGFMLFVGMLLCLFFSARSLDKRNNARWLCLTLVTSWLILSMTSHSEVQKYTWIIFGLTVALFHNKKRSSEEVQSLKLETKKKKLFRKRIVW